MTTYFVTRHAGAVEWAKGIGVEAVLVAHLDSTIVKPGDTILGTVPFELAADVIARGGKYFNLEMKVPAEFRGKDLTAADMNRFGARLQEYRVERL